MKNCEGKGWAMFWPEENGLRTNGLEPRDCTTPCPMPATTTRKTWIWSKAEEQEGIRKGRDPKRNLCRAHAASVDEAREERRFEARS